MGTSRQPATAIARHWLMVVVLALLTVGLAGCGGAGDSEAASDVQAASDAEAGPEPASDADGQAARDTGGDAGGETGGAGESAGGEAADESGGATGQSNGVNRTTVQTGSMILKGQVAVTTKNVDKARLQAQQLLDRLGGSIAEEETSTDPEGNAEYSRLVLRVPSADFDEAMTALAGLGKLETSDRQSEDVGSQVRDVEARVRAQEKSLLRLESFLGQAAALEDIIRLESEIAQRQADLDALKAQRAYLADQTAMATITAYLSTAEEYVEPEPLDDAGFLAGLKGGWKALTVVLTGLATVTGALIPFAVALGIVGVPLWLLVRAMLRRRTARAGEGTPPMMPPAADAG